MKQKRKVKSLLPQRKDRKTSFLTTLLLVLSTILCIGSASLLTSSVFAADSTVVRFTGLNDNVEVLYNLKFVDPEHLSGDGVADVYFHDNSLYISPSPVIVNVSGSTNKNEVKTGVYSNILGGENNTIYSDNVTIIAGKHNIVMSGGANSTILGGMDNGLGTGAVSIGGRNNEIENTPYNRGIYLIGGKNVKVINSVAEQGPKQNIFVLGGDNSSVTLGSNIIIGGSGLKINTGKNIFAFSSPRPFTPMSGKTFYLNMENGVGIGTSGVPGGLAVNGAFMLLNEQSKILQCTGDNIGQIYLQDGCLIGCTKISSEIGAGIWEILNRSEHCKTIINPSAVTPGDDDYFYPEEEIPETPSYTGYCIPVDFTGNTRACSTPEVYQNVFFETSIVDQGGCNALNFRTGGENKCVFECIDGYHLGYDSTAGTGCYADCELNGKTIKHNQTGTWYNKSMVLCSDGVKCATCAGHAKTLMCKNGNLYYYSGGRIHGKVSDDTNNKLYKECTLYGGYYCERHGYNLSISDLQNLGSLKVRNVGKPIEENLLFSHQKLGFNIEGQLNRITNNKTTTASIRQNEFNWSVVTSSSARGYYQLCKDYNGMWGNTDDIGKAKSSNVDCGTPSYNYKLIGCKTGYTMLDGKCQAKCSLFIQSEGKIKEYLPGARFTGYKKELVKCGEECEYAVFECRDKGGSRGEWEPITGYDKKDISDYNSIDCGHTSIGVCRGYNIDGEIYNQYDIKNGTKEKTSIYESCQTYKLSNIKSECNTGDVMYKLAGCKTGYHTENGLYCISNERIGYCNYNNMPVNSVLSREGGDFEGYMLEQGEYLEKWTCGWYGVGKDCWAAPYPENACDYECNSNAEEVGGKCIVNGKCSEEKFMCDDGYEASEELTGDNNEGYYWKCRGDQVSGTVAECHLCNEDYPSYNETTKKCVKNECTGPEFNNARLIEGSDENLVSSVQRTLYASESEAAGKKCAYVCYDDGYYYDEEEKACKELGTTPCGKNEKYTCETPYKAINTGSNDLYYIWDCEYGNNQIGCQLCISPNANGECEASCIGDHPDRSQNPLAYKYDSNVNIQSQNERKYVSGESFMIRGCAWTCNTGFKLNSAGTGCVETCSGTHPDRNLDNINEYIINRQNNANNHEWKYFSNTTGLYQGCAWTCASGYAIDNSTNPSKCVKKPGCGTMSGLVYVSDGGIVGGYGHHPYSYLGFYMWNACPDGKLYPNLSYSTGREDGECGHQIYNWQCQHNEYPSVITSCSQPIKMAYYNAKIENNTLKISSEHDINYSTYTIDLKFTDKNNIIREHNFSVGATGYAEYTGGVIARAVGMNWNDIKTIEIIGEKIDSTSLIQGGFEGFAFEKDKNGSPICTKGDTSRIIYKK